MLEVLGGVTYFDIFWVKPPGKSGWVGGWFLGFPAIYPSWILTYLSLKILKLTSEFTHNNGWLEDFFVSLFGNFGLFSGAFAVGFREGNCFWITLPELNIAAEKLPGPQKESSFPTTIFRGLR